MTALLAALADLFRRLRPSRSRLPAGPASWRHELAMLDGRLLRDIGLQDVDPRRR
jgi:hypothetical protein